MQLENIYHWYTASGALVVELPPETDLQILVKGLSSLGGLVCFDSSSAAADGFSYAVDAEQPNGACFLDRFSFVAADPIETFIVPSGNELGDAEPIREVLGQMKRRMSWFFLSNYSRATSISGRFSWDAVFCRWFSTARRRE